MDRVNCDAPFDADGPIFSSVVNSLLYVFEASMGKNWMICMSLTTEIILAMI
jgi:hypothetical protein